MPEPKYSKLVKHWLLDKSVTFLNHGSFGACPTPILEKQSEYRKQLESEPLRFMMRECDALLAKSKNKLSAFVNCNPGDLVFINNATSGVNTVLKSLNFKSGSEILITNHIYPACKNTIKKIAKEKNLTIKEIKIPLPVFNSSNITDKIINGVNSKTAIVLIDHISSIPGIRFPVEGIVNELNSRNIDVLVDGAHAPGMVPLNLNKLNAPYYTGNCHKWICSPKGSAFLFVREDKQKLIKPLVTSRLYGEVKTTLSEMQYNFSWQGTFDPTPYICIADAIDFMGSLFPGGWKELMKHNHELALSAGKKICNEFEIEFPYLDDLIAGLMGIPFFKDKKLSKRKLSLHDYSPLQDDLFYNYNIEVVVNYWEKAPQRILRISPQVYNDISQYEYLIYALKKVKRLKSKR